MSQVSLNLRPVIVGVTSIVLDKYLLGEAEMMKSVYFGGVVAAGVYASEWVAPMIALDLPSANKTLYNGKTLSTRLIELAVASGGVFVVNKYMLLNDTYRDEVMKRVGVILLSDIAGTYATEYINGQPMSFFN